MFGFGFDKCIKVVWVDECNKAPEAAVGISSEDGVASTR